MKRVILLFLGTIFGLLLTGVYVYIRSKATGLPEGDDLVLNSFIFQCGVIFIGSIYNTGAIGYRILGDHKDAEEIRAYSKVHIFLVNFIGAVLFVCSLFLDKI